MDYRPNYSQKHSSGNKNHYHLHNAQSYSHRPNSNHHSQYSSDSKQHGYNNKTHNHHSNTRTHSVQRHQDTSDNYTKNFNHQKPPSIYQSSKNDSNRKYQSHRTNDDSSDDHKAYFSKSTTNCYKPPNRSQSVKTGSNMHYQKYRANDNANDDDKNIFAKSTYPKSRNPSSNFNTTTNQSNQNFGKSYYKGSQQYSSSNKGYIKKYDDDDDDDDINTKGIYRTQVPPKLRTTSSKTAKAIDLKTQEGRKAVADETVKILKTGKYTYTNSSGKSETVDIGTKIFNCQYSSETYRPENYEHYKPSISKGSMCTIEVKPESTFGAARRLCAMKLKTCVLNFASATKPGGGFKNGKKAQEESLSRQSALYVSLEGQKEMYQAHLANKYDNVYKDYMIYSRAVPVFRDDKTEQLLPGDQVFCTDVITSAAPWKAKIVEAGGDLSNLDKIIYKRCKKILRCAIDNKVQALVLGAYGCGVFGNKPKDISQIFKKLLIDKEYGKYFKIVEFAITGKTSENFIEFSSTFKHYMS